MSLLPRHPHDRDKETNIILYEHPLDAYFRELRDRRRRELARRRLASIKAMQVGWLGLARLHRPGSVCRLLWATAGFDGR